MNIYSPFTDLQIERLTKYQDNPFVHPYTCSNGHKLIIEKDGMKCYDCSYKQDWASNISLRLYNYNPYSKG